jgi:hypothetical protein
MSKIFMLTHKQLNRIKPYFPLSHGKPCVDDQAGVRGIMYVIKNGLQRKDAPSYACWNIKPAPLKDWRRIAMRYDRCAQLRSGRPPVGWFACGQRERSVSSAPAGFRDQLQCGVRSPRPSLLHTPPRDACVVLNLNAVRPGFEGYLEKIREYLKRGGCADHVIWCGVVQKEDRQAFMKTLIFSYVQAALSHLAHTTGGSVVWNTCGRQIGGYEFLPADAQSTCLSLYAPSSLRTS